MGGMIAQLVAADYPEHTLSLTSIMSTTGNPSLPRAKPATLERLGSRGPDPEQDLEGYATHAVETARMMGSPGYPLDEAGLKARIVADYRRSYYPVGL